MEYWAKTPVRVIYLDGSETPIQKFITKSTPENIKYIHLPVDLYQRLNHANSLIKTEYTALLGDDEFFLTDAIVACVSRLEHASELVSCCGCALGFFIRSQQLLGFTQYPQLIGYSVSQERASDRLAFHMLNYVPSTIYGITRTPVWKKAISIVTRKEFSAYAIGEIQFELAVHYLGKTEVIPQLMWLRSHEAKANRGQSPSLMSENSLVKWWTEEKFLEERKEFFNIMSEGLSEFPEQIPETKEAVKQGFINYIKFRITKEKIDKRRKFIGIALGFLPTQVKNMIRSTLSKKAQTRLNQKKLVNAAKNLEKMSVSVDFSELNLISDLILKDRR